MAVYCKCLCKMSGQNALRNYRLCHTPTQLLAPVGLAKPHHVLQVVPLALAAQLLRRGVLVVVFRLLLHLLHLFLLLRFADEEVQLAAPVHVGVALHAVDGHEGGVWENWNGVGAEVCLGDG